MNFTKNPAEVIQANLDFLRQDVDRLTVAREEAYALYMGLDKDLETKREQITAFEKACDVLNSSDTVKGKS